MKEQLGWSYGNVTNEFVNKIKSAVSNPREQVFWIKEVAENDQEVFTTHSQDKSRHKAATPEVVVFPHSPGILCVD